MTRIIMCGCNGKMGRVSLFLLLGMKNGLKKENCRKQFGNVLKI